jgi:hypothetical protein
MSTPKPINRKRKQVIKLNNVESLQGLMQETYNDAVGQIFQLQNSITEIGLSVKPEDVDDVTKIAREKSGMLKLKDSAIRIKLEVGKIMVDLIKHDGNIENSELVNISNTAAPTTDDLDLIRQYIKDSAKTPE